jgi:hypothetical protein
MYGLDDKRRAAPQQGEGPTFATMLWGLLRMPARGSMAAPKGHTAIGREESISRLDGQTLVVGLIPYRILASSRFRV